MKTSPEVAFLPCSYGWPIGLGISFGMLERNAYGDVASSPSVILVCRGQGRPRQYILTVWIPLFVLEHFFLLDMDLGLDMKWTGVPRSFGPTVIMREFKSISDLFSKKKKKKSLSDLIYSIS